MSVIHPSVDCQHPAEALVHGRSSVNLTAYKPGAGLGKGLALHARIDDLKRQVRGSNLRNTSIGT